MNFERELSSGGGVARGRRNGRLRVGPRFFLSFALCAVLWTGSALVLGCSRPGREADSPARPGPQDAAGAGDVSPRSAPELVSAADLARVVAEYRGKVVLVDYWATWCSSCVAMLPHVVQLSERFESRGLVVITVSLDFPSQREQVGRFLQSRKIPFRALLSAEENLQQAFVEFDLESLPTYRIYDRSGRLRATLSGDFREEDLDRAVLESLDSPASQ